MRATRLVVPTHFIESLESRQLLAGLTLLAHGYAGNVDGWVKKAAGDITTRAGGPSEVATYVLTVERSGEQELRVHRNEPAQCRSGPSHGHD